MFYANGFSYASTSFLYLNEATNTASVRNATNQQTLRVYNTYTNASNYERLNIAGVAGTSVNLTADSAGTGAANLNVVLTPKGSGYTLLNGKVGIGTTSPAQQLDVVGDIKTSGCLYYASSSLGTCASDARIKKDVHPFKLGLDHLLAIDPVRFKYNGLAGFKDDGVENIGVIAQNIEKAAPQLVKRKLVQLHPEDNEKTEIKIVDYGSFTYVIINAIKDFYHKWFDDSTATHRGLAQFKKDNLAKDKKIAELEKRLVKIEKKLSK